MSGYYDELLKEDPELTPEQAHYTNRLTSDPTKPMDHPSNIRGEAGADADVAFAAGFVEDPKLRMRIFARARYPDMPIEQALKRYGYVGDKVVYVDEQGNLQKEVAGWPAKAANYVAREGLPMIGGAIGSAFSPVVGTGAGAAAGLALRKDIGQVMGDPVDRVGNAAEIAGVGVVSGLAGGIGNKLGNFINNRQLVRDITNFDPMKTEHVMELGRQFGIEVTPAEASQLGSLIRQQTRLGMGMDEAGDIVTAFYRKRAGQQGKAIEKFIGKPPTAAEGGAAARKAGKKILERARAIRRAQAQPYYKEWVRPDILVSQEKYDALLADPKYGTLIKAFTKNVKKSIYHGDLAKAPPNSLAVIDAVGKELWDTAGEKSAKANMYKPAMLRAARHKLLAIADSEYDGYAAARRAFKGASPLVDRLDEGIEGYFARLKDDKLAKAGRALFTSRDVEPETVRRARLLFWATGKRKEWDGLVDRWLKFQWESVDDSTPWRELSKPMWWQKRVFGSQTKRDLMQEAMGPQRFKDLSSLMEVLEKTLSVPKGQSMTEPAFMARAAEERAAAPIASAGQGAFVSGLRKWWVDKRVGDFRTEVAKVVTNQKSMSTLEQLHALKSVNPEDPRLYELAFMALAQAGVNDLEESDVDPTIVPPMMQGAQ